ncbi:MAG: hypothetical protein ACRDV9_10390 [Acidimicrobiia bacterium]
MAEVQREVLVVLSAGVQAGEVLPASARVTQRASDRVLLAEIPPAARESLQGRPEIVGVYDTDLPDAARSELDDMERLFVDAWRYRANPKKRVGEGVSWDAPGFRPPL